MLRSPWTPAALVGATLAAPAKAGPPLPPPPCNGSVSFACNAPPPTDGARVSLGAISRLCCPEGAKCNYATLPYTECGYGSCVYGRDPGRCPTRGPATFAPGDGTPCNFGMEKVCLGHKVVEACVSPYPTNYAGPPHNPEFKTCGDRCTTSPYIEDCFPTRKDTQSCTGKWTPVCLGGVVAERCLPETPPEGTRWAATTFTVCKDQSCAIGGPAGCDGFGGPAERR